MGTYLFSCGIIGAEEPFSIPSGIQDGLSHFIYCFFCTECFLFYSLMTADGSILFAVFHKHGSNEDGLCYRSLGWPGCLERFAWF